MLAKKIFDVPVYLWAVVAILLLYLLYLNFYKKTTDTMANATPDTMTNDNTIKLYNFNTSWCGHSVRFQEEWNKFANEVKSKNNMSNVKVYDIKCDNVNNEKMCSDYEVPGFPSVVIEKNGVKELYDGPRTADALLATVEQKL